MMLPKTVMTEFCMFLILHKNLHLFVHLRGNGSGLFLTLKPTSDLLHEIKLAICHFYVKDVVPLSQAKGNILAVLSPHLHITFGEPQYWATYHLGGQSTNLAAMHDITGVFPVASICGKPLLIFPENF
jgi:hypothetical protein